MSEAAALVVPSRQLWALPGGGPAGLRVLELGHRLLLGSGQPGRLVMPDSPDEAARIRDWLAEHGQRDEWQESSFDALLVQRQKRGPDQGGLLLLPKPASEAARELLERRLRRSDWPLVMV